MSDLHADAAAAALDESTQPRSPPERDMTAPMRSGAACGGASPLPHSASSWEMLDMDVAVHATAPNSAHGDADALSAQDAVAPTAADGATHVDTSTAAAAATADAVATACGGEPPAVLLQLLSTDSRHAVEDAAVEPPSCGDVAASRERLHQHRHHRCCRGPSPAHSASSAWSLMSTPPQTHLTGGSLPAATAGADAACAAAMESGHRFLVPAADSCRSGIPSPHDAAVDPLHAEAESPAAWRVESLPSSLLLQACHAHTIVSCSGSCDAVAAMHGGATPGPILIPQVISMATASVTSDGGEPCVGDWRGAGAATPVAATALERGEDVVGNSDGGVEEEAAVPAESPHAAVGARAASMQNASGEPAVLLSWLPQPLVSLSDRLPFTSAHHTAAVGDGDSVLPGRHHDQRRAVAWLSRRISFLSSSPLAASLLSAVSASARPPASAPADAPLPSATTTSAASSMFLNFALDSSRLWSRACVLSVDGSHCALRGLHQLCDYVWQDLKEHWYPQLRLVLGDRSSVRQARRSRRVRRRLTPRRVTTESGDAPASRPAEGTAAVGAAAASVPAVKEPLRWRSVSSPCFLNGDVRVTRDSAAQPFTAWRERSTTTAAAAAAAAAAPSARRRHRPRSSSSSNSSSSGHTSSSEAASAAPAPPSRDGRWFGATITAEAVASAAQGLLVFLL
ncbi:hypothetical protein NESM_000557400 [Novymonas esmeraldas]|uniref:Uncharacterized protein n=1 Tax=Novymonas esmeraldas TaxID=1808958 RepID=A0AAW0ES50_9TRYP